MAAIIRDDYHWTMVISYKQVQWSTDTDTLKTCIPWPFLMSLTLTLPCRVYQIGYTCLEMRMWNVPKQNYGFGVHVNKVLHIKHAMTWIKYLFHTGTMSCSSLVNTETKARDENQIWCEFTPTVTKSQYHKVLWNVSLTWCHLWQCSYILWLLTCKIYY